MDERKVVIESMRIGHCELSSTIYEHCYDCLYVNVSLCGESQEFEISRDTAKAMIETIVGHFKKRHSLTDDEADAIARLI